MKKFIVVLLSLSLVTGCLVGCGKKEEPQAEQQKTETGEVVSMDTEKTEEEKTPEVKTGEWEVVNLPFDQAPEEVKTVFNKAMESVQETLTPTKFLASQVVSGMNYAFLATDDVNADRYIYIYKNAKNEIERIEISKPNETLEILPNEKLAEVLDIPQADENANTEESNTEETTQPEVINHNEESSNANAGSNNSGNSGSNSNSSSSGSSSNSSTSTEQKPTYKNAEEALIGIYGSKEAAIKALNSDGKMDLQLKENDIIYSYTYPEELDADKIKMMKDEIVLAMKGEVNETHKSFIRDLEKEGNISGVKIIVKYSEKTGKEIVTVEFDKDGMK